MIIQNSFVTCPGARPLGRSQPPTDYLELLQMTRLAGTDVHSKDSYNGTGLIRAAERGYVEIIRELLKTDIEIDHITGWDGRRCSKPLFWGKGEIGI